MTTLALIQLSIKKLCSGVHSWLSVGREHTTWYQGFKFEAYVEHRHYLNIKSQKEGNGCIYLERSVTACLETITW